MTWETGNQVVLASTSRSQKENEEFYITSVSNDGRNIGITPPVKYQHISLVQTIAGRIIETRAEVGLLTRNVVVEGSENDEWTDIIPECPDGFDPGIFAVQTCFQGRYGEGMGSEQFGSQIMINARMQSKGLVTGRISYVEVRRAGQAFGLGMSYFMLAVFSRSSLIGAQFNFYVQSGCTLSLDIMEQFFNTFPSFVFEVSYH